MKQRNMNQQYEVSSTHRQVGTEKEGIMKRTDRQQLGDWAEQVTSALACPGCRARSGSLLVLEANRKLVDLQCSRCDAFFQVKAARVDNHNKEPRRRFLGAAWGPVSTLLAARKRVGMFFVLRNKNGEFSVYFLAGNRRVQPDQIFQKRKPLSPTARRAGWIGTIIDLNLAPKGALRRVV